MLCFPSFQYAWVGGMCRPKDVTNHVDPRKLRCRSLPGGLVRPVCPIAISSVAYTLPLTQWRKEFPKGLC
jgi:hypothetical protein